MVGHGNSSRAENMTSKSSRAGTLRLSEGDNVVVATGKIEAGQATGDGPVAAERIPFGHKMAAVAIAPGAAIVKFGQIIGFARIAIAPGEWVHEHNVDDARFRARLPLRRGGGAGQHPAGRRTGDIRGLSPRERPRRNAQLYRHTDKRELFGLGRRVSLPRRSTRSGILDDYPNVDGIVPLHPWHGLRHGRFGRGLRSSSSAPSGAMPPIPTWAA